jgi:TonB family protein
MSVRAFGLVIALLGSIAAAPESSVRQPTSKWLVEFAENQCLMSRAYGSDKAKLTLAFERFPMDNGIYVYVLKPGKRDDLRSGRADVSFGTSDIANAGFGAGLVSGGLRRTTIIVPEYPSAATATTSVVSVSVPGEVSESFAVPEFAAAMEVMRQCVIDLGEHWGISAEEQQRIAIPAKPVKPLATYFDGTDYPTQSLRNESSGRTNVRIVVAETGQAQDCVVMKPSGDVALDKETCRILLRRARFLPAVDRAGKPMKSVLVTSVNWLVMGG